MLQDPNLQLNLPIGAYGLNTDEISCKPTVYFTTVCVVCGMNKRCECGMFNGSFDC